MEIDDFDAFYPKYLLSSVINYTCYVYQHLSIKERPTQL